MWTNDKILLFIEDLHENKCLWDVASKDYRNHNKKNDVHQYLSTKYEISVRDVEKKISNLKCQFRREHKKLLSSKKSGLLPKKVSWFAYEALSFLVEPAEPRGSRCTTDDEHIIVDDDEETSVEREVQVYETRSSHKETPHNSSSVSILGQSETETNVTCDRFRQPKVVTGKKRASSSDHRNEVVKCLKALTEVATKRDDFDIYGEYLAIKLRNSKKSHKEIAIAQHYIDQICFNLIMGIYGEGSKRYDVPQAAHCTSTPLPSRSG